jgi:hypothetical protein
MVSSFGIPGRPQSGPRGRQRQPAKGSKSGAASVRRTSRSRSFRRYTVRSKERRGSPTDIDQGEAVVARDVSSQSDYVRSSGLRFHRVDVRRPEEVNVGETHREQRILGLSLVASKGHPTSSGRVCASAAQKRGRCVGAAATENARELDRMVHGDRAEPRVRYRAGIRG